MIIKMEENDTFKLKRLQYEKDSLVDLISRNMNAEVSQYWFDRLVEATANLDLYKQEITEKYVAPKLAKEQLDKATWKADFIKQELEVTVNA